MLNFSPDQRIFLAVESIDMQKQFDELWAMASERLVDSIFDEAMFCFTNKEKDQFKILFWDCSGVWVFAKRLEKGRFSWPKTAGVKIDLDPTALTMLLSEIALKDGAKKRVSISKSNRINK
jgi:transposase